MVDGIAGLWGQVEAWLLALVDSAWALPTLFATTAADGFFPPVPGETVIVTLAVAAQEGGGVAWSLVLLVAALGAWCGDQLAYSLGRALGTRSLPVLRGARGRRTVAWAARALDRRGSSVVLGARFVPVGRTAVNVTAGAVGFSRRRFMGVSAVASVVWAGWSVALGMLAARWLGDQPLLAVAVGVVAGILLGFVVDRAASWWSGRRDAVARRRPLAVEPRPSDVEDGPTAPTPLVGCAAGPG
ncbi:DedA family protein [Cellulosimicrobium arenosum]|uniref:DedA family protein n=1 Tax=Cellulosimicrobium arenosum TaxID=2708133 RepID=A0A927J121_9MICO|nr:DedA family protein [Cellulosimicrobium arenosum]MBD8079912.1 DedA family protein [Cellulosimicrobium arenosum]